MVSLSRVVLECPKGPQMVALGTPLLYAPCAQRACHSSVMRYAPVHPAPVGGGMRVVLCATPSRAAPAVQWRTPQGPCNAVALRHAARRAHAPKPRTRTRRMHCTQAGPRPYRLPLALVCEPPAKRRSETSATTGIILLCSFADFWNLCNRSCCKEAERGWCVWITGGVWAGKARLWPWFGTSCYNQWPRGRRHASECFGVIVHLWYFFTGWHSDGQEQGQPQRTEDVTDPRDFGT